jgi:Domain of unknown function (DUF4158)
LQEASETEWQEACRREALCYLRFPGRTLGVEEIPPPEIIGFVAAQLGLPASAWLEYAKRDQTRREQLQELQRHSGLRLLAVADYRRLAGWVTTLAMQTSKGIVLVQGVIEEMRQTQTSSAADHRCRTPVRQVKGRCVVSPQYSTA